MTSAGDGRIPLTLVTGFLGSGKTTLIRQLLRDHRFASAAIVVNELGEQGIDHHLFRQTDERITLLRGGCACCARRDDLLEALVDLIRSLDRGAPPTFDRVLLETTGLADPAPILHTIVADPLLSRRYRVEQTVVTLDAVAGRHNLISFDEALRQVAAADVVVVTKQDLAAPSALTSLSDAVTDLNPSARILVADHGRIDPAALLDNLAPASRPAPDAFAGERPFSLHAPGGVSSLTLEFAAPLDWPMLGLWLTMLLHCHGQRVLRVKGLLDVGDAGPLLLEGVQHVVHAPRHLPAWPDDDRRSRLVFIVRDLDPAQVEASLAAFQALAASS